ncbi:hypothetical protein L1987_21587 [Smallanthus sonchifolius]|uniref:Uncharacterized protein n=1 Tax=Smallanthus sonchifolius TaxID=185202 RepID=A0ACB9IWF9_9ASTR|nr:hypothetical protein L1987_21587 [Smallanthus sonchifolius]
MAMIKLSSSRLWKSVLTSSKCSIHTYDALDFLPSSVNWVTAGAVPQIKNQGHTNACWAFAAVSCVEALNFVATSNLVTLSEQEIYSCERFNQCGRGNPGYAFNHIVTRDGIASDQDLPFTGQFGDCYPMMPRVASIDGYGIVPHNDELALKWAVAHSPVAAVIEADESFCMNSTGIITHQSRVGYLNHCVTIVGYNSIYGLDYWLIRNSWGKFWGNKGYGVMPRNIRVKSGCCNMTAAAYYPIKKGFIPPFPTVIVPRILHNRCCHCRVCFPINT